MSFYDRGTIEYMRDLEERFVKVKAYATKRRKANMQRGRLVKRLRAGLLEFAEALEDATTELAMVRQDFKEMNEQRQQLVVDNGNLRLRLAYAESTPQTPIVEKRAAALLAESLRNEADSLEDFLGPEPTCIECGAEPMVYRTAAQHIDALVAMTQEHCQGGLTSVHGAWPRKGGAE